MIFLVGPRQVGKTTLAKSLLTEVRDGINYFNWDIAAHRKLITTQIFTGKQKLSSAPNAPVVFDEIHRYPRWKNALKGLFDKEEPNARWIVTGSAAFNVYRKGQDSLLGRAFTYHLCPLSVAELCGDPANIARQPDRLIDIQVQRPDDATSSVFDQLLAFGGFPEPFLKKSDAFLRRWRASRLDRLVNQDLASTEHLRNLPLVEQLMFLLPERVGSPLSLNNLREDLEVHYATIKHWMALLERVFYGFFILPHAGSAARMLKKEPKWYLWDWTEIADPGHRFENLVAVHLSTWVRSVGELGLDDLSLSYVRDKEKREVDFLISGKRKPLILLECKRTDSEPSKALLHHARALKPARAIQLVADPIDPVHRRFGDIAIDILPAASFLRELV
jgi:uncharacterized protein